MMGMVNSSSTHGAQTVTFDAIPRSCDQLAFRHYGEPTVHLYRDCPEGKLIGIARREAVTDQTSLEGLELCAWCQAKYRTG